MPALRYKRYCREIVGQTFELQQELDAVDLHQPVDGCPRWSLGDLVRHLGYGHRWATEIVREEAKKPPSDERLRQVQGDDDQDAADLGYWLAQGATGLTTALRAVGKDAKPWSPLPDGGARYWARRYALETLIHRVDVAKTLGRRPDIDADLAADGVDEWLELVTAPTADGANGRRGELRKMVGKGRTIALVATDGPTWTLDLSHRRPTYRPVKTKKAGATIAAPAAELLLVLHRRIPVQHKRVKVSGDKDLVRRFLKGSGRS